MRCCVPFCKNTSDNVSEAEVTAISFHGFPSEVHLRAAWLRALGKQDSHLPDNAVVCSQHFLNDDIQQTESGLRQIGAGAIPSTVQVCMICLDTDSKLILMSKHRLQEAYEKLTGHPLCDPGNLKQTVCVQCAQRLRNFSRFRDKSLRARALMMDLVEKNELVTRRHIQMINRTKHQLTSNMVFLMPGPDHCDLHILEHPSDDKQTELEVTGPRDIVKTEENDDSMSIDGDMQVMHEEDNNVSDFVQDPLKYETAPLQCTLCLDEFVHEHDYKGHIKSMHLQNGDGDGECATSQVRKPHTAVSSSSSHSSLSTENKQADPSPSAHSSQTSVIPLSARLARDNENKVKTNETKDAVRKSEPVFQLNNDALEHQTSDISCKKNIDIDRSTNCAIILYDIFKNPKKEKDVLIQDPSYEKTPKDVRSSVSPNIYIASKDKIYYREALKRSENVASETDEVKVNECEELKTCEIDFQKNYINIKRFKDLPESFFEKKCFVCDVCSKTFKRKSSLIKHIKLHSHVKHFSCALCEYKCNQRRYLVWHMKRHAAAKPYACDLCEYKCAYKSKLVEHRKTHTGAKPFACDLCEYKCAYKSNLVGHRRTHTGEKPYSCTICEYKCSIKSSLNKHMATHTGEKPFTCKICNKQFAHSFNLVRHKITHTGNKPFTCKICNRTFACNSYLVKHMINHTGEKLFSCKICNRKFAQNRNLVKHMYTHTGEKPFHCKLCEYKCARKSNLPYHMRTHTGEKPYSCNMCDRKFASSSILARHMRSHPVPRLSPPPENAQEIQSTADSV